MSLTHSVGRISGSAGSSIQYPITVWDDAFAAVDAADAIGHALAAAPSTLLGLLPVSDDPDVEEIARHIFRVVVEYTPADVPPPTNPPVPDTGTLVRRASFQAKGKYIERCIEPIGAYDNSGLITVNYEKINWCAGISGGGNSHARITGLQIEPLPETFSLDYYAPNATVTKEYLDTIADLCGSFNDSTWNDYPQGSLQLVRFNASERNPDDWDLSFGFGYQAPQFNVAIADDVTLPELRGSWTYWTNTKEKDIPGTAIMQLEIRYAVVQRVWDEKDFYLLDLPGMT